MRYAKPLILLIMALILVGVCASPTFSAQPGHKPLTDDRDSIAFSPSQR